MENEILKILKNMQSDIKEIKNDVHRFLKH